MIPGQLCKVVIQPSAAVVSLQECKADLRVDSTAEDELIQSYLDAAVRMAGEITGRTLAPTGFALSVAGVYAGGCLRVPFTPVTALTAVKYFDLDGIEQTQPVEDFRLYSYDDHAIVEPVPGKTWPTTESRRDALTVEFTAGYADAPPASITKAIRMLVAHWYENRTAVVTGTIATPLPMAVETLLGLERVNWSA